MKKIFSILAVMLLGGIIGHVVAQQTWYSLSASNWNQTNDQILNLDKAVFVCSPSTYMGKIIHLIDNTSAHEVYMPLKNSNALTCYLTAVTYQGKD